MHCPLTVRQYRQRLIANLPAVAERAVERRPPPQLREPGQRRRPVLHASGQQHPTRAFTPTVGQFQFEHIAGTLTRHHLNGPHFDGRVGGNLPPPGLVQLARRSAVVTQQPADAVGGQVALLTRVDQQRSPPRPAEYQTCAQARGSATDDDAVPYRLPDPSLPRFGSSVNLVALFHASILTPVSDGDKGSFRPL